MPASDDLGAHLDRLHSLTGVKWTDDPDPDVIPSWVADMDFEVGDFIKDAMRAVIDRGDTGYNFHARNQLIEAWGQWQHKHFGWTPPAEECRVFTATLNCLNLVIEFMTEPGDGVVVFSPIYYPFRAIVNDTARRLVDVPLDGPDWRLDAERLEAAIDPGTKVILWCNPHNPLGRAFDAEEIAAIADVAERHDLLIVSDEIWCDLTFEPAHIPLWREHPEVRNRTITLGAASKSFNIAGLRTAVAHIGDPATRARFDRLSTHFIAGPNTLGAEATLAAWTHGHEWLDTVKQQLRVNRDHLVARVRSDLGGAQITPPQSTYLAWIDFASSPLPPGNASELFRKHARVGVHDGSKFCPSAESAIRVNFATSTAILDELIDRMATVVQEATS